MLGVIKFVFCSNMKLLYIILLFLLPMCSYILINKIIIEKSFTFGLIAYNKLSLYDFSRIFFISYVPYMIFWLLSFIIKLKSKTGFIGYILSILYSAFIAQKLLIEFLLSISILNKETIPIYFKVIERDKRKIYFIFLIIYYLISHILNL